MNIYALTTESVIITDINQVVRMSQKQHEGVNNITIMEHVNLIVALLNNDTLTRSSERA